MSVHVKLRRASVIVAVAVGFAAVTLLIGLVTNAASEQQWPDFLTGIQRNPWPALAVLVVVAGALTALLAALPGGSVPGDRPRISGPTSVTESPASAAVMRTLPRDVACFTNRENEVKALLDHVDQVTKNHEVLPVHTIDGMPGVGKTAFAIHAGHLLSNRFPDGQYFINLNGHTPGRSPVDSSEALASLLLADGLPPQRLPSGDDVWAVTEARAALWRSRVANRKLLVILDNAISFEQVEYLLPGESKTLIIVTSRRRLGAPEAVTVKMEALPPPDAADLFVRLAGRDPVDTTAVDDVVRLAGYLPLAISLLAARLRHHPSWRPEDLRDRLAAQGRLPEMQAGDRAVAAAFDLSYRDLDPAEQRLFRGISLFPGLTLDEHEGAAMVGVSPHEARRLMEILYNDHLLDENENGRYRLHDLLREYGRERVNDHPEERADWLDRLIEHYRINVEAANRFIGRIERTVDDMSHDGATPGFAVANIPSREAAFRWMDDEVDNVLACIGECVKADKPTAVISLAAVMAPYLRHAGPWDRALDLHRAAAAAAVRIGDRSAEAGALGNMGMIARLMADYRWALDALEAALAAYRETGDLHGQAQTLNQVGIVRYLMAAYREATEAQTESLAICRGLGDRYGEANAMRDLGIVSMLSGEYATAEMQHLSALSIYEELNDRAHQGYALNEIGRVRRLLGDHAGAVDFHELALRHYVDLGDRFGQANSIHLLGVLQRMAGDHEAAAASQTKALNMYLELGSRGGEADSLREIGVQRRLAGELGSGHETFQQAVTLYRQLGDRIGQAEAYLGLGYLRLRAKDAMEAMGYFRSVLDMARSMRLPLIEAYAARGLSLCHSRLRDRVEAAEYGRMADVIFARLNISPIDHQESMWIY